MKKEKLSMPLNNDLVNFQYMISIPIIQRNEIHKQAIATYVLKYPELKKWVE